ncbi:MAG: M48 family metalloprotease [Desulfobacterales bacterium]|nr:M48 family metalloprotease [Desulfobacterales bacterium]
MGRISDNSRGNHRGLHPDMGRRRFIKNSVLTLAAAGLVPLVGCSKDPVTGKKQFVMMSRDQEIGLDRHHSPFQFSSDYGVSNDAALNGYISQVGKGMVSHVHRPRMPYNFQCVNATYVNAYAFPGGTIAVTRGILLELENEAELAALLGHELGHVNARHSAEQATKGQLSALLIGGISVLASGQGDGYGQLTQQLGALGQGLFLSKYSRDNEREADALGHEYMVKGGYSSKGFVGLMEMLNSLHKSKASAASMLFATHPMGSERLSVARNRDRGIYNRYANGSLNRERYMDMTASLRRMAPAIKQMQEGEKYLAGESYGSAEKAFQAAVKKLPRDYTGQLLLAKCYLSQKKAAKALPHAREAAAVNPKESQAPYIAGLCRLGLKQYRRAHDDFSKSDRLLPGNPQLTFFKGYSQDNYGNRPGAARDYQSYLKQMNYASNKYTQHAYKRLKAMGYIK